MKINFLIPTTGLTGGVKVIIEYANRLSARGHEVTLVYPYILPLRPTGRTVLLGYLKMGRRIILRCLNLEPAIAWPLNDQVKILRLKNLAAKRVPDADVCVATANQTADWLNLYPSEKGRKFYFIQDYETWSREPAAVDATWRMPFKKIVISEYLATLAREKLGVDVSIVLDGVDRTIFDNPRPKTYGAAGAKVKVLMMYHPLPKKGVADGLAAFFEAKKKYLNLELTMFGAYHPGRAIPAGVPYHHRPTPAKLRALYSSADIFLWPSRVEGFGLPPLEAMACRCAVITTDTGAARYYTDGGRAGIIVPPNRPDRLAAALVELAGDRQKLVALSEVAYHRALNFDWEKSVDSLEKILTAV